MQKTLYALLVLATAAPATTLAAQDTSASPGGAGGPPPGMPAMPTMSETTYDTAVEIADGKIARLNKAVARGVIGDVAADGTTIQDAKDSLNGLIIRGGRTAYSLRNSHFELHGTGKNDFLGIGAGVLIRDSASAVLDRVDITTNGPVSSALVSAEGATVRVYDSHLVANGGKLPEGYKPTIGPGMMEPPPPLGLNGTARTVLAMTNSRTFLYNTRIEADGWGALSTDQSGGNLYLEANDCTVIVRNRGYGTYADFGAHVVINRGRIESGAYAGIIAGAARLDLNGVSGTAHDSLVMIHSVMSPDPMETGTLTLSKVTMSAGGPLLLVKSANADIAISGGDLRSESHVLLEVRKNDDANATKVNGRSVPGVHLKLNDTNLRGDIIDSDPDRKTFLVLRKSRIEGTFAGVTLSSDAESRWLATADSEVWLDAPLGPGIIDAPTGVTVRIHPPAGPGGPPDKEFKLPGGGRILIVD